MSSLKEYLGLYETDYIPDSTVVLDKERSIRQYVTYMLNRTAEMFEWSGLPDTIPYQSLERMLQTYGYVGFAEAPLSGDPYGLDYMVATEQSPTSNLFAFRGGLSGPPSPTLTPTRFVVANPSDQFSPNGFNKTYTIGKDCYIMKNDSSMIGLLPMHTRYASVLAENDVSIRSAQINLRAHLLIIAENDVAMQSANDYIRSLVKGEIAAIADKPIVGNSRTESITHSGNALLQLMEMGQYQKASWFNEVGLNFNFNMKREYTSAQEVEANTDILMPLVDDMLRCREFAAEQINKLFGTNISVKKNSAWEHKEDELNATDMGNAPESGITQQGGEE